MNQYELLIYLVAAVIAVPIFKRLGLGSVLGYLAAGVVIGPSVLGLVWEADELMHGAEFGVVLLLFLIGLELQPSRLWAMRRAVFGVGTLQVAACTVLIAGVGLVLGLSPAAALVAGLGLSLSSTAFAIQLLAEKNQLAAPPGRAAFGILLFQDIAVIPVLALLPLLGVKPSTAADAVSATPMWLDMLKVVGVLVGVVAGGRFIIRPIFRVVARSRIQELFTAAALLTVVGTAWLVGLAGLSASLGAFLAGVLLADSEFRTELEADIEPFKGLLLGLFFIAVGMSVNVSLVIAQPFTVLGLCVGFLVLKTAVITGIGRLVLGERRAALILGLSISQGGEFAFVLFTLATSLSILDTRTADLLVVVVSLSMAASPVLYALFERFILPRLNPRVSRDFDVAAEHDAPVIVAGFGRVGQVVGRVLTAKHVKFTAMDASPEHIDFLKKFGNSIFYGDASRLDLLRAARADKAKVFVLAIDDVDASVRTAKMVMEHFPNLTIFARARNRQHAYALRDLGVTHVMRETFAASVEMTRDILGALGLPFSEAQQTMERFRQHDEELIERTYMHRQDVGKLQAMANQARAELEKIFDDDRKEDATG